MAAKLHEGLNWQAFAHVDKYSPAQVEEMRNFLGREPVAADWAQYKINPDDMAEWRGNQLVTAGLGNITNLIVGGGGNAFSNAKAIVGVGSSATAYAAAQVALQGDGSTTTAYYQPADASNPTRTTVTNTNDTIQCIATFASANANFAWNEWCWGAATSGTVTAGGTFASVATTPVLLNRKVVSLGTKASGASWVFTTTITLS